MHSAQYIVHCTVYTVHFTLYIVNLTSIFKPLCTGKLNHFDSKIFKPHLFRFDFTELMESRQRLVHGYMQCGLDGSTGLVPYGECGECCIIILNYFMIMFDYFIIVSHYLG